MEAWRCAAFLAVLAESLSVDEERGLMDHRRVRTSRLPPLSRREKPCLRAGGCWGGFAGGELFRVGRYVSTGAREVVRDFERKMRHCVRRREKSFSSFLFRFRGNCGKVSPGGLRHLLQGASRGAPRRRGARLLGARESSEGAVLPREAARFRAGTGDPAGHRPYSRPRPRPRAHSADAHRRVARHRREPPAALKGARGHHAGPREGDHEGSKSPHGGRMH